MSYGKQSAAAQHGGSVLHWVAVVKRGNRCVYCDPMGRGVDADAPLLHIRSPNFAAYLRRLCPGGIEVQKVQLENWGGTTCGQWSMYMCLVGSGPLQAPLRYTWLTPSIRRNQQLVKQLVKVT